MINLGLCTGLYQKKMFQYKVHIFFDMLNVEE